MQHLVHGYHFRKRKVPTRLSDSAKLALLDDLRASILSRAAIRRKYGISHTVLLAYADKAGIVYQSASTRIAAAPKLDLEAARTFLTIGATVYEAAQKLRTKSSNILYHQRVGHLPLSVFQIAAPELKVPIGAERQRLTWRSQASC